LIPVIVKAPTGDVDIPLKPNSVLLLVIDGDGRPFSTRMDVPHVESAKRAGSQAMKDIMAASREAAEPKAKPPEEAEDTQPEDE
jgi:hypothetical protein